MTEVEKQLAETLHKILSINLGVYPQAFDDVPVSYTHLTLPTILLV